MHHMDSSDVKLELEWHIIKHMQLWGQIQAHTSVGLNIEVGSHYIPHMKWLNWYNMMWHAIDHIQ